MVPANRALIVEDEPLLREFETRVLRRWGYEVEAVSSCANGEWLTRSLGYSLYLLDAELPDGSGIDLCRIIRARGDTVIVVCSGKDYELAALRAGANAFVSKGEGFVSQLEGVLNLTE
jgi:DNA-binding response OmpR family regulator